MDPVKNLIALVQEQLQKIPLAIRQKVYSYGAILASLYAIWVASNGDWDTFWKSLVATAVGVLARANAIGNGGVDGSEPDLEDIDGETFDEAADPDVLRVVDEAGSEDFDLTPGPEDRVILISPNPDEVATVVGADRYGNVVTSE